MWAVRDGAVKGRLCTCHTKWASGLSPVAVAATSPSERIYALIDAGVLQDNRQITENTRSDEVAGQRQPSVGNAGKLDT